MADERVNLEVKERESRGSADSRRLRARGLVPGVLYGDGKKPYAFTVEERELRRALTGGHVLHAILDVVFDGQKTAHHAVLKDYQLDPTRARLLHVDLHEVRLDQVITAQVAVETTGESPGVKEGGVLTLVLREVRVEALPMEVPDRLELDISSMTIGDSLRIADVSVPDAVELLDDPESVVAIVTPPTKVELPEEVEEEEEALEGEELPEGEAEAAAEEATATEGEGAAGEQPAES
jgi:large subunit ribosomal protein L25